MTHQVVAVIEHDCYEAGDIVSRHGTWAEADRACVRHNALYIKNTGLVCKVFAIIA